MDMSLLFRSKTKQWRRVVSTWNVQENLTTCQSAACHRSLPTDRPKKRQTKVFAIYFLCDEFGIRKSVVAVVSTPAVPVGRTWAHVVQEISRNSARSN